MAKSPQSRGTTVGLLAALATAAVIGLVSLPGAGGAGPVLQATAEQVYTALGVDRAPADYIVMVDVSASMQQGGRYDAVKNSLRAFFAALAPEDQVAVGTFASSVTIVRQGPAGRAPDELVAALPATATGTSTDIGAAIEAMVKHLQRTGAPPIATVVLLTDGAHEPPRGSPYPFQQGYAWDKLAADTKALQQTSLSSFAIPLAGATGAPLLGKVFAGAQVVDPTTIDRLTVQLEQPKAAARKAKARAILGDDATRGVQVQWPGDAGDLGGERLDLTVGLHSTAEHIPLVVDGLTVRSGDGTVRATVHGGPVSLAPGATQSVRVTIDWDAGGRRAAPLSTVSRKAGLELAATIDSPWSQVLRDELGTAFDPELTGAATEAGLSAQRGSWPYWIAAGGRPAGPAVRSAPAARAPAATGAVRHPAGPGRRRRRARATPVRPYRGAQHRHHRAARLRGGARRTPVRSHDVDLRISYSRDGTPQRRATGDCAPASTVTVGGVEFTWQAPVPGPRRAAPASGPSQTPVITS